MLETKASEGVEVLNCPICSDVLKEYPKRSAILFVCSNCGFKIYTAKELFSRCLRLKS